MLTLCARPQEGDSARGCIRAKNVYALTTQALPDGRCELRTLCWVEMGGLVPLCMVDKFVVKMYPKVRAAAARHAHRRHKCPQTSAS